MKVTATLKNLRIAPRKVRLVTHSLIGVDTREALVQLEKQVKKSSDPIRVLLESAIANASNNFGLDRDNLYVFAIRVGDGLRLERWLPRAFGRATPLIRRGSNITIILEERIEGQNRTEKKKPVAKTTPAATEKEAKEEKPEDKKGASVVKLDEQKDFSKNAAKHTAPAKVVKKVFQRKAT